MILAIDLGTTSCKLALFDMNLKRLTETCLSYSTDYPESGWAEQPSERWWQALVSGMEILSRHPSFRKDEIRCIGIDSMGCALVPVDKKGNALHPALLWMDRRSEEEACQLEELYGREIHEINGNRSDPSNMAPKILWMKKYRPDVYDKTDSFLTAGAYLVRRLTGNNSMNVTESGLSQLCGAADGKWDRSLLNLCGIDEEKLPPIFNCHEVVGETGAVSAEECSLPTGIPVVAGAMDMCSAALGSGVLAPGQVYISAGTVTAVGACIGNPSSHPSLQIYPHVIPGLYISAAGVDYGGAGLKWFKDILELEDFSEINNLADKGRAAAPLLFLPYMVGQRAPLWNSSMSGAIAGLRPDTDRAELYRMLMQGTAFAVRRIFGILEKAGHNPSAVRITGGCSLSPVWMQIFADSTGIPFSVPSSSDVAVLGAACTAAFGAGLIDSYESVLGRREDSKIFNPKNENLDYNNKLYSIYNDFLNSMLPVMRSLAELQTQ